MGIKGAPKLIKEKQWYQNRSPYDLYDVLQLVPATDYLFVDVFGSFYQLFLKHRTNLAAIPGELSRMFPNETVMVNGLPRKVSESVCFVFDGQRTQEKELAHLIRDEKRLQAMDNFEFAIGHRPTAIHGKKFWIQLDRYERQVWVLNSADKVRLAVHLSELGYRVVIANGEADNYIAKEGRFAISNDSDLMFHSGLEYVFRPFKSKEIVKFNVFSKQHAMSMVALSNEQWTVLAIVSGNDYSPNVPHFGIRSNLKIIKRYTSNEDTETILFQYVGAPSTTWL